MPMAITKHLIWTIIVIHICQWFASVGTMHFDSVEDFGNTFGPHAAKIMGDLPNFTNIEPIVQISEVM